MERKTISEQAWKEQRNRNVKYNTVKETDLYDDRYMSLDLVNPWLWAKSRV